MYIGRATVPARTLRLGSGNPSTCGAYYCTTAPPAGHRVSGRVAKLVLRGSPRRWRPLAFSPPPCCQGAWGGTAARLEAKSVEPVLAGELRAVVEGDRLALGGGQGPQQPGTGGGHRAGRFAWGPDHQQQAGVAFRHGQHRLAVVRKRSRSASQYRGAWRSVVVEGRAARGRRVMWVAARPPRRPRQPRRHLARGRSWRQARSGLASEHPWVYNRARSHRSSILSCV